MKTNILKVFACLIWIISGFNNSIYSSDKNSEDNERNEKKAVVFGTWIIKKAVAAGIVAITYKEANVYIGKKVILKPNFARFIDDSCQVPSYDDNTENADYYFDIGYKINKKELGIKVDSVYVVQVGCKAKPFYSSEDSPNFGTDIIVLNEESIVICIHGFFFFLEKSVNILKKYDLSGKGKHEEKILLPRKSTIINLSYEFFHVSDKITIKNQLGETLYESKMVSTHTQQKTKIYLSKKTDYLILKIENVNNDASSKWKLQLLAE